MVLVKCLKFLSYLGFNLSHCFHIAIANFILNQRLTNIRILSNVCAMHWGLFSALGVVQCIWELFSVLGVVQCIGSCSVHRGLFSALDIIIALGFFTALGDIISVLGGGGGGRECFDTQKESLET